MSKSRVEIFHKASLLILAGFLFSFILKILLQIPPHPLLLKGEMEDYSFSSFFLNINSLIINLAASDDCEIVDVTFYQREQPAIITDWYAGIPYMRYQKFIYPCATITVKNNFWQSISSKDLEITAVFTDKSTATKRFTCEERRLAFGESYTCSICFESEFPISSLECNIR